MQYTYKLAKMCKTSSMVHFNDFFLAQ